MFSMNCFVCEKDISILSVAARELHVNECLIRTELLEKAFNGVLPCPLCHREFTNAEARSSHLKRCSQKRNITTTELLQICKAQEQDRMEKLAAGVVPSYMRDKSQPSKQRKAVPNKVRSTQKAEILPTSIPPLSKENVLEKLSSRLSDCLQNNCVQMCETPNDFKTSTSRLKALFSDRADDLWNLSMQISDDSKMSKSDADVDCPESQTLTVLKELHADAQSLPKSAIRSSIVDSICPLDLDISISTDILNIHNCSRRPSKNDLVIGNGIHTSDHQSESCSNNDIELKNQDPSVLDVDMVAEATSCCNDLDEQRLVDCKIDAPTSECSLSHLKNTITDIIKPTGVDSSNANFITSNTNSGKSSNNVVKCLSASLFADDDFDWEFVSKEKPCFDDNICVKTSSASVTQRPKKQSVTNVASNKPSPAVTENAPPAPAKSRRAVTKKKTNSKRRAPSPFSPMPDFNLMNTPDLQQRAQKFGLRSLSKNKTRILLKHIYNETHKYETDTSFEQTPHKC